MDIKTKRTKIIDYIVEKLSILEPEKKNANRYKELLSKMNDTEFSEFMQNIKDKKYQLHIYMPNMKSNLQQDNILACAKSIGLQLFEQVWLTDTVTGKKYLTPNKYLVVQLPVRRVQQYLLHKMSIPKSDRTTDMLTGQVVNEDQSSAMSQIEIQCLFARDLKATLTELVKVRGGDLTAYANLKGQLEETGQAYLNAIDPSTTPRSVVIASVFLKGMMIDNNLYETM